MSASSTAKSGEPITVPAPFGLVIDTGEFPAPRDPGHPSNAATTTSTGTDSTVDTRIASRASVRPTR